MVSVVVLNFVASFWY